MAAKFFLKDTLSDKNIKREPGGAGLWSASRPRTGLCDTRYNQKIMTKIAKQQGADIRVVGTRSQIDNLLAAFSAKGFTWKSNEHFYPRIGQEGFFSYYLENLESTAQDKSSLKG